jgi:hypothetical protein
VTDLEGLEGKRRCPTCDHLLAATAFYANCAECKGCKRQRSQRNRALQARKIAAFERFADALVDLAARAIEPSAQRRTGNPVGSRAVLASDPGPSDAILASAPAGPGGPQR